MPDKRERPRNLLGDLFELAYFEHQRAQGVNDPAPYFRQKHDYIQLARLLVIAGEANWPITPERFGVALRHYFESELPGYPSLGHLAARFSNYYRGALNKFGQPLNAPVQSTGKNARAIQMMRSRYSEEPATDGSGTDLSKVTNRGGFSNGGRR